MGPVVKTPAVRRIASDSVDAVRAFNRFYNPAPGSARELLARQPLFVAGSAGPLRTVGDARRTTSELDLSHESRLVTKPHAGGLVKRSPSPPDRRQCLPQLTAKGIEIFKLVEDATRAQIAGMLDGLSSDRLGMLLRSMLGLRRVLDPT